MLILFYLTLGKMFKCFGLGYTFKAEVPISGCILESNEGLTVISPKGMCRNAQSGAVCNNAKIGNDVYGQDE